MAGIATFVRGWFEEPPPPFEFRQSNTRWGRTAPRQTRRALRVADVIQETPSTRTFVLESPEGGPPALAYRASQHLTLLVDAGGGTHRRCYSCSSSPLAGGLPAITVKRVPDGVVSRHLHDQVRAGDTLLALDPTGDFTLQTEARAPRHLVLVAGGVGITPVANAPNARNSSNGVFLQDEWTALDRLRVTAGLRWQEVSTEATDTPGWETEGLDFADDQLVGALTATWQITESLNALASYGTAFRAPNIIERLFNGATPEGNGYQILNPDLVSETSDNFDVGFKYRRRDAFFELVGFRNEIEDAIVQYILSDAEIAALPPDVRAEVLASRARFVVQQRNVERLRYQGVELALGYRAPFGLTVGGNVSYIDADRVDAANPPPGGNYGEKYVAYLRYEPERRRFWAEDRVRHNASADANLAANEPVPPVGSVLPAFTIHALGAGLRLFERAGVSHDLQVTVENLTDELYAEFSNATFFRPEPGRSVKASYRVRF